MRRAARRRRDSERRCRRGFVGSSKSGGDEVSSSFEKRIAGSRWRVTHDEVLSIGLVAPNDLLAKWSKINFGTSDFPAKWGARESACVR